MSTTKLLTVENRMSYRCAKPRGGIPALRSYEPIDTTGVIAMDIPLCDIGKSLVAILVQPWIEEAHGRTSSSDKGIIDQCEYGCGGGS